MQTGGPLLGETWTKSRLSSCALFKASLKDISPKFLPDLSINITISAFMFSFIGDEFLLWDLAMITHQGYESIKK